MTTQQFAARETHDNPLVETAQIITMPLTHQQGTKPPLLAAVNPSHRLQQRTLKEIRTFVLPMYLWQRCRGQLSYS